MADLRFQIALTNVSFDENYENVLRFETREEQEKFFDVSTLFSNAINVNFVARNLIDTQAFFRMPTGTSLVDMLTKNYAIVYDTQDDRYLYYFIKRISQDDSNQVQLNLTLDVFQTFYLDTTFSDCLIERANLNRFVDNGDDTVSFDGTVDSKLFEREPIKEVSQRLTSRKRIQIADPGDTTAEKARNAYEFITNDVIAWIYVFVDPTHTFTFQSITSGGGTIQKKIQSHVIGNKDFTNLFSLNEWNTISTNLGLLCFPITKGHPVSISGNYWNSKAFQYFIDTNGYDYVYSVVLSTTPPFPSLQQNGISVYTVYADRTSSGVTAFDGTLESDGTITLEGTTAEQCQILGVEQDSTGSDYVLLAVYELAANILTTVSIDTVFDFSKSEIVGATKNIKFNPKLLSSDFKTLKLKADNTSEGYNYNIQKLNTNTWTVDIVAPPEASISKKYATLKTTGYYIAECAENYTGDLAQNDNGLNIASSAYQTMLANNKNYFLQNAVNRWANVGTSALASGAAIGTGVATGNVLGVVGGAAGVVKTGVDLAKSIINENLTVDNLKNAPGNLTVASGSAYLNFAYANLGVYIEEYDALPNEKQIANDYMDAFGFTYNRIDNIKNNDDIRHFHNYVQASVSEVTGVSNEIRQVFVDAFGRGVRFWNAANIQDKSNPFDYSMENYENWLAE